MHIQIVTPAAPKSRSGNRTTATRWASLLKTLGHRVAITEEYNLRPADLMVALHAWRSARSINQFRESHPEKPLVVALTGTDIYRFQYSHPEVTLRSMQQADILVGLHEKVSAGIPVKYRNKVTVIFQSALPTGPRSPTRKNYAVCVAGHLRKEKDPMRPAYAVRNLPSTSRIDLQHFGKACSDYWAHCALRESQRNPRYHWHGEVSHGRLRKAYAHSHLLVLPSRMEGGANVISEAITGGLPVIASRIDGSVGLLGDDYPGYFTTMNTGELRNSLLRAETDSIFYRQLQQACRARKALFTPAREKASWKKLLKTL